MGKETTAQGLLNALTKTNRRNMAYEATEIIKTKVDDLIHADNPTPTQAIRLLNREFDNIKAGTTEGTTVITGIGPRRVKYPGDSLLEDQLSNNVEVNGKTIEMGEGRINTPERKYKLNRRGYIELSPRRETPKKWDYTDLYSRGYSIITSWLPGDLVDGTQHRSAWRDGKWVRLGNIQQVRGRDLLVSAFLCSISQILSMMKRKIKRNFHD